MMKVSIKLPERFNAIWTEEDDDLLLRYSGSMYSLSNIASRLNRTEAAVSRRLERLGISSRHALSGFISANMLSDSLGVDTKVITRLIRKAHLPGKKYNLAGSTSKNQPFYINIEDFWKWAGDNKELIDWRKYERLSLPPEPLWLQEMINLQHESIPVNSRKIWSTQEESEVWRLFYVKGKTQKEIALLMGRSINSIEKKLKKLREENHLF